MIRLRVIEGPNTRDQIVLCAFHSFLVEIQMNAGYIHVQYMLRMHNNNLGRVVRSWVKITGSCLLWVMSTEISVDIVVDTKRSI